MARRRTVLIGIFFAGYCLVSSRGNATGRIAEGTRLATTVAVSEVNLENGVNLRLSPRSAGTVFGDHIVLEQGALWAAHFNGFAVDADRLEVQATDANAQAVIRISNRTVEIAAIGGELNVTKDGGILTRVVSGTKLSFQKRPTSGQTGAAPGPRRLPTDRRVMLWTIGITAAAAVALGSIAAAQGKSPF